MQSLRQYRQDALSLTGLLFTFSAPVLGLVLYFLGLVASMLVHRQRNEIAVLRSRGASRRWIIVIYLFEWALLTGFGLAGGIGLSASFTRMIGQTQSFLLFSRQTEMPLRLTGLTLGLGLVVAVFAVLFSLLPAWQAGQDTIVSYKQELGRARRRPFWQRAYLDVLLLLPSLYGLYVLRSQGRFRLLNRLSGSASWLARNNPGRWTVW